MTPLKQFVSENIFQDLADIQNIPLTIKEHDSQKVRITLFRHSSKQITVP